LICGSGAAQPGTHPHAIAPAAVQTRRTLNRIRCCIISVQRIEEAGRGFVGREAEPTATIYPPPALGGP
jgi:hypothetical protein